jgi:hypothetical protein
MSANLDYISRKENDCSLRPEIAQEQCYPNKKVSLVKFRTLPGSMATGCSGKPRLTNLMQRPDGPWKFPRRGQTRFVDDGQEDRGRDTIPLAAKEARSGALPSNSR